MTRSATASSGCRTLVRPGRTTVAPMRPSPVGGLTVRGLRLAGRPLDVRLTAAGDAEVLTAPPDLILDLG
jgi:hypothetical protein